MFKKSFISLAVLLSMTALSGCEDSESNSAPTLIELTNTSFDENEMGAIIGNINVSDPDSDDSISLTVDNDNFEINGTSLKLRDDVAFNYESQSTIDLSITATDSANNILTQNFQLSVNDILDTYSFTNAAGNESSVAYGGQVARHLLISELNNYINSGLSTDLDTGSFTSRDQIYQKLLSYYQTTDDAYLLDLAERTLTTNTTPISKQTKLAEISSSKKDLSGKIAGNDPVGQHKDWTIEFVAFGEKGSQTPEQLIVSLLAEIANNAAEYHLAGNLRRDPFGNEITKAYLASDGRDLKQLVQKILLGSVAYSQATDDYLDNDTEGKGLLSDNTELSNGQAYTSLEHQFDEGFGYFGAARDYLDYTDQEIAGKGGRDGWANGYYDTDGDGMIDFESEYNFGHSQNAAKRDLGSAANAAATDYTTAAMQAFLQGRQIIANANASALTEQQMSDLVQQRDIAVQHWEKAIVATAIHYINATIADYDGWIGSAEQYANLAKHWSELKGFVVTLQFNPLTPMTDTQFENINALIGDSPELNADLMSDYIEDLLSARASLQDIYQLDTDNVANW